MEVEACPVWKRLEESRSIERKVWGSLLRAVLVTWWWDRHDRNFFFFFLRGKSEGVRACLVEFATSFISSTSSNLPTLSSSISCIIFIFLHFLTLILVNGYLFNIRLHISDNCSILFWFKFEKSKRISIVIIYAEYFVHRNGHPLFIQI